MRTILLGIAILGLLLAGAAFANPIPYEPDGGDDSDYRFNYNCCGSMFVLLAAGLGAAYARSRG